MRWPEGPPHLALNPPYFWFFVLLFFCFFWAFPFLTFNRKKPVFPPRKGHFLFIFESPPLFLLSLFWPPPFSVSLSLSLSCSCLSFLLLFFLLCFLLVPCFVSCFVFVSSLLFFHEKNNIRRFNCNLFSSIFSLFWFPVLLFLSNPFALSLLFPDFKHDCFWFQNKQLKKHTFLAKRRVATKRVLLWTCVLQTVKSYLFLGGLFWAKFGWCSKTL